MSSSGKSYPAPIIPDTPSKTINDLLRAKCDHTFDNPIKYGVAVCLCFMFTAIVRIYHILHREMKPSHTMWMASCAAVSVGTLVAALVVYSLVIGCSFLLHWVLYYFCVLMALGGSIICVAGAIFFDKDGSKQSPGFESTKNRGSYESSKLE